MPCEHRMFPIFKRYQKPNKSITEHYLKLRRNQCLYYSQNWSRQWPNVSIAVLNDCRTVDILTVDCRAFCASPTRYTYCLEIGLIDCRTILSSCITTTVFSISVQLVILLPIAKLSKTVLLRAFFISVRF